MIGIDFESVSIKESGESLVDLAGYDFVLDAQYHNMGLSTDDRMFLRRGVAEKLSRIQEKLGRYKFKVWDGYRPRSVQKSVYRKFWRETEKAHPDWNTDQIKNEVEKYVSLPDDPGRIPPHSTGGAVDLTLVDLDGRELDMGTVFDSFQETAAALYYEEHEGSEVVRNNRRILREAMIAAGFLPYPHEWWHYDYGDQVWAHVL